MLISVIIPTLNRSRFLMRALLSLVQQEYKSDYEIIVVDNGSKMEPEVLLKISTNASPEKYNTFMTPDRGY